MSGVPLTRTSVLASIVVATLGFTLGRMTAPARGTLGKECRQSSSPELGAVAPDQGGVAWSGVGAVLPTDPAAVLDDPTAVRRARSLARGAVALGADPADLVASAIDEMDDDTLVAFVSSLTDYERADLEAVTDIRGFVTRLATLAMDGTIVPGPEPGPDVGSITFATDVLEDNSPFDPARRFGANEDRIYAVFDSRDVASDRVLAKWTRVVDGEVLVFERLSIDPGEDWGFVWLGRPAAGWQPGEYRVDLFAANEQLAPIASGTHVISR